MGGDVRGDGRREERRDEMRVEWRVERRGELRGEGHNHLHAPQLKDAVAQRGDVAGNKCEESKELGEREMELL